jgi:hypothetical protein
MAKHKFSAYFCHLFAKQQAEDINQIVEMIVPVTVDFPSILILFVSRNK